MWRLCRGAESVAARRRARLLLEPLGITVELGRLYARGADAEDPAEIAAYIERAVDIARSLELPELQITALNGLGYLAACRLGDYESPAARGTRTRARARSAATRRTELCEPDRVLRRGFPTRRRPNRSSARRSRIAKNTTSRRSATAREGHYALALLDVVRWDEALEQAHEVLATRASPINRLTSLITAGLVAARRGDPERRGVPGRGAQRRPRCRRNRSTSRGRCSRAARPPGCAVTTTPRAPSSRWRSIASPTSRCARAPR